MRLGEDDLHEIQKFIDNNAESVYDDEKIYNSHNSVKTPLKNWEKNFLKIHQIFSNSTNSTKKGLAEVVSLNNLENSTDFCVAFVPGRRFPRGFKQNRRIIEIGRNNEDDDNDSIW